VTSDFSPRVRYLRPWLQKAMSSSPDRSFPSPKCARRWTNVSSDFLTTMPGKHSVLRIAMQPSGDVPTAARKIALFAKGGPCGAGACSRYWDNAHVPAENSTASESLSPD